MKSLNGHTMGLYANLVHAQDAALHNAHLGQPVEAIRGVLVDAYAASQPIADVLGDLARGMDYNSLELRVLGHYHDEVQLATIDYEISVCGGGKVAEFAKLLRDEDKNLCYRWLYAAPEDSYTATEKDTLNRIANKVRGHA